MPTSTIAPFTVLAISHFDDVRQRLTQQLHTIACVAQFWVVPTLADAYEYLQRESVSLVLMDLTSNETDGCLFIETINYQQDEKTIVFGLHKDLEPSLIIRAVSSGVKEFIHYPEHPEMLTQAVEKHYQLLAKLQHDQQEQAHVQGRVMGVFSAKGGSGASTLAINLAYELTQSLGKQQVLLLDCDASYSNLTSMLNIRCDYGLSDIDYSSPQDFDTTMIEQIIVKHPSGVNVLMGCKSIFDDSNGLAPQLVAQLLEYLKRHYKAVVVDMPSRVLDEQHQVIASECDDLLLVCAMDIPTLYRGRQYLELAKQHLEPEKIKLIINRHDLKGCVGVSAKELEGQYNHRIYHRLPNQWQITVEAASVGRFLSDFDAANPLCKGIKELAMKLMDLHEDPPEKQSQQPLTLLHKLPKKLFSAVKS